LILDLILGIKLRSI